ncbi:transcriptional regulator [Sutcliffiella cohnii]|uniref:Transcriptional regulator n=1 Tax=Sutcliffiella cohnii TaxID=33932 RepID=A0A223KMT1_9BACI|nr:MBOAT family O-acyltransferase [Sutcliffiella cohnii]AST90782.1 transcriptional regulator [Sutcliffiella cohnii]
MVFSSLIFIFFFLPISLLLYYLIPKRYKNVMLLFVSLFFYAWGEPVYIFLMLFSALADYIHGRIIYKYRKTQQSIAKLALWSSISINIAILSFFKYADFLIDNVNVLLGTSLSPLDLPLPIGISFYTFQTMSYCIDIYRGQAKPQRSPVAVATYVCLFPQLIAGPIVRYQTIEKELMNRKWDSAQFANGICLFIIGLGKKVLLANNMGQLWVNVSQQPLNDVSTLTAWIGIIAFAFQIYFDFSGYSDMAKGLGKMFGFTFPKNFDYPYTSRSVTEFWRRWHITLGSWFRDYVYIPLGGSKKGFFILVRNLIIVWGLTGVWHGASWNFIIWGLYFGIIIFMEKRGVLRILSKLPTFLQRIYLIFLILIGWVLFVFEDIALAFSYFKVMFYIHDGTFVDNAFFFNLFNNLILLVSCFLASMPVWNFFFNKFLGERFRFIALFICYVCLLISSIAYLVDDSFNPFLYFRF